MRHSRPLFAASVVAVALAVTGCAAGSAPSGSASGSSNANNPYAPHVVNEGFSTKGGNVNVLMSSDFQTLDPGNSNYVQTANVGQLYYRTLTMAKETAGQPPKIVPDLATDLGKVSSDGLTWTYTLKDGLKYEDGSPITSADIKYGIERTFARDVYTQAPQELNAVLDADTYKGPYTGGDLAAVETPDAKTVIFHLKQPYPDFPSLASRSNSAPVPQAKDTKLDYTNHPISSGPYMISSYDRGRELKLVRNPNWDAKTDENRTALPDTFSFSLSTAQATISQQLLSDSDPTAITLDSNGALQASDAARLTDATIKPRTAAGLLGCTDVLNLNTTTITDPDVRHALALAMDRAAIQVQYGGKRFGQLTNSYLNDAQVGWIPPTIDLDPNGKPKLDEAKKLLQGKTVPKTLTYGYSNATERFKNLGTVLQQNFKELGIDLQMVAIPAPNYYTTLAGDQMPDIARAGWCGGAASASTRTTVDPNLGPSLDGTTYGFSNISRYFDPTISGEMYKLRDTNGSSEELNTEWTKLYNKAMETYPIVPLFRTYTSSVVGSKIQNAQVGYFFGSIDLSTVGVKN
ncbi:MULTISPECIES: ABC transporter substrate-binding protein [unclassified Microbacterium]|uniref:ABC transporter substrate-binding protein n=1 Tax=unclassified Microbacterium TaxID=2609290 RepID=UPI001ACF047C|nr:MULTISPECIES: ABC transporter substrate-binding protein [unclassified Microbacterium]MBN9156115.1 ABC transporter substrate-binding protein [Microbacterium sp.]MBS1896105.1 ABC transporter substrate-binding protein [Actinomycetota bacterium]